MGSGAVGGRDGSAKCDQRRRRRADRRPDHRRGRLHLLPVRANSVAHQRHRLPSAGAFRRGGRLPGGTHRRAGLRGHLRRSVGGPGGTARRVRTGGRIPDRLSAAAPRGAHRGPTRAHRRAIRLPRKPQAAGETRPHPPRRRARGAQYRRQACLPAGFDRHRRRAARRDTGRTVRRGRARRTHRGIARLDSAARRRSRRSRGRGAAQLAARWKSGERQRRPCPLRAVVGHGRPARDPWQAHQRHPVGRPVRVPVGTGRRRRRPRRPTRSDRCRSRAGEHPVRAQPGNATLSRHRTRRRGAAGGHRRGEVRHVRRLGRQAAPIHRRARGDRDAARTSGAHRTRAATRCGPRLRQHHRHRPAAGRHHAVGRRPPGPRIGSPRGQTTSRTR